MYIPQLPWLQTAICHTGHDDKNESHAVHGTHFCQYQAFISCAGVTRSGCITCYAHWTLMTGLKDVACTCTNVYSHVYVHVYSSQVLSFSQPLLYDSLNYFKLIGIVCGLAIYNTVIIDLPFPTALYKKLLKK